MVVWARRTPENRQRTARTQTVRTQIPLLPQSHRLRIFAPRTSMDHHRQDSGFFGFFLALAAVYLHSRARQLASMAAGGETGTCTGTAEHGRGRPAGRRT